jgi:hypothetical protein
VIERHQARRIFPVGQHDDDIPAHLARGRMGERAQLAQRDVDRVVHRRGAAGGHAVDGLFEGGAIVGERLQHFDAAIEVDDLGEIAGAQPLNEVGSRLLRLRELVLHAAAAVDEQRHGQR